MFEMGRFDPKEDVLTLLFKKHIFGEESKAQF